MDLKVFHESEWKSYPAKSYEEYTYEWLGEPHASVSVRLDGGGNETARNIILNPSRQIDESALAMFPLDASALHDNVGKEALAIFSFKSSGTTSRPDAYIRDNSTTSLLHDLGYFSHTPDYTEYVISFVIPEEVTTTNDLSFTVRHFAGSDRSAKNVAVIIPADETVLIDTFFDGDTPSDRAWVDFQPRNISGVKRIWPRSSTPPPAGTTFEWAGESESIKRVDGVEVARNYKPTFTNSGSGVSEIIPEGGEYKATGGDSWRVVLTENHSHSHDVRMRTPEWPSQSGFIAFGISTWSSTVPSFTLENSSAGDRSSVYEFSYPEFQRTTWAIPYDSETTYRSFWIRARGDENIEGQEFALADISVAFADSEDEALAQVETYFDGNTPDDRANDLWYNQDGVPHEWVNGQGWVAVSDVAN